LPTEWDMEEMSASAEYLTNNLMSVAVQNDINPAN
jgi:hypothetical protein